MALARLTEAAWLLLQRLAQDGATVTYTITDGHFHFGLKAALSDIVRESTLGALIRSGFVRRERGETPIYSITALGRAALESRNAVWVDADPDDTAGAAVRAVTRPTTIVSTSRRR